MIKSSSKQKLQGCKQQQTALGKKDFGMVSVPITCLRMMGPLTMKLGALM